MTRDPRLLAPSDAELVAYLDGELSPADSVSIGQRIAVDAGLSARVEVLMKGARPFRQAFEPLLAQAPAARLDALLTAVLDQRQPATDRPAPRRLRFWSVAVAAGIALVLLGAGLDRLAVTNGTSLLATLQPTDGSDDWRRAVAQYLSLYTSETLSIIPDTGAAKQQELAGVGSKLGVDLTPARVDLPDLTLKRAEMFDYDGKALGFLAYLDPRSGPISLCIIAAPGKDLPPQVEHRRGMNVVYWSRGQPWIHADRPDRCRSPAGACPPSWPTVSAAARPLTIAADSRTHPNAIGRPERIHASPAKGVV